MGTPRENQDTPYRDQAEIAAQMETYIYKNGLNDLFNGDSFSLGGKKYEVLEIGRFDREAYGDSCCQAIAFKDENGNVFIHFKGTGDGNWEYNAVAYGEQNGKLSSPVQDWSLKFFNDMVEKYYVGQDRGSLYVMGHSQGGNNAQYVTLASRYCSLIEACVELDGPGFSDKLLEHIRELYGEGNYEKMLEKIYAYNGVSDFVSILGQEYIVPDGHTFYVQTPQDAGSIIKFHTADGMLDENGHLNTIMTDDSEFRKLAKILAKYITDFPPEKQEQISRIMMKLIESATREDILANLTQEELELLKECLTPILIDVLENEPEALNSALVELGVDPSIIWLVDNIVDEFNDLSPENKEKLISILVDAVLTNADIVNDDGSTLVSVRDFIHTIVHDPDSVLDILDDVLGNHPELAVVFAFASPFVLAASMGFEILSVIADKFIHFVESVEVEFEGIRNFLLNTYQAFKEAIGMMKEWLRYNLNAGVKYARENPYIKVDPTKLREYAMRIGRVNQRLSNLDSDLRSLYWQVGFLDLWDILMANLITCESFTLNRVKSYLNDAADGFESAENQAVQRMGG